MGGGLTSLTRHLAAKHSYTVIDFMAHDAPDRVSEFLDSSPDFRLHEMDWSDVELRSAAYDVVVANDLFCNVDQRIAHFLDKVIPVSREIRLSLTYYNEPRYYRAKRIDTDEVFSLFAWSGHMVRGAIEPFVSRIDQPDLSIFDAACDWIFANRRQVCLVTLKGDLADPSSA